MQVDSRQFRFTTLAAALAATFLAWNSPAQAARDFSLYEMECCGTPLSIASNNWITGTIGAFGTPQFWEPTGQIPYTDPQPFTYGFGIAINKDGLALISANENGDGYFFWQNGKFTQVPAEIDRPNDPLKINDQGQIAVQLGNGHAGIWQNGLLTDLGTIPGGSASFVKAFNQRGDIGGSALTQDGSRQAVLWSNGTVALLGVLPGDVASEVYAVSETGEAVGFSFGADNSARPFRWSQGIMTQMAPAGTFTRPTADTRNPSRGVIPTAMNSAGQIIANDNSSSDGRAILWENGVITELNPYWGYVPGTYGCTAWILTETGQISGACDGGSSGGILVTAAPSTNLSLIASASNKSINVGNVLQYTLDVVNLGTLPATGVTLTDELPASVTVVSATPSQGRCIGSNSLRCDLGDLASDAKATVQIEVIPNAGGRLSNTPGVSGNEVDSMPRNNSSTISVDVIAPVLNVDAGVSLTASASSVKRNSKLTYTAQVTNSGPGSASNVTLKDVLPAGMSFNSVTTTLGSCSGTSTITCNLGSMASGSSATVSINVTATTRGTFTNTATVTTSSTDTNSSNNTGSVKTSVR